MKTLQLGFAIILLQTLTACGDLFNLDGDKEIIVSRSLAVKSADGVKLLVEGNDTAHDSSLFEQTNYIVGPGQNLLIRYEDLLTAEIDNSNQQKMIAVISFNSEEERDAAASTALLCPVESSWMMLATWYRAHPFSSSGKWDKEGGDYIEGECLTPLADVNEFLNEEASTSEEDASDEDSEESEEESFGFSFDGPTYTVSGYVLGYDIKDWYVANVLGMNQNHGFLLKSETDIEVIGNGARSGPRFYWLDFAYDEGPVWSWD